MEKIQRCDKCDYIAVVKQEEHRIHRKCGKLMKIIAKEKESK